MAAEKISSLETDLKDSPDNPELLLELAQQYMQSKQPQRALEVLRSAFKIIPQYADLAATIGNIAVSIGQTDTALYYFKIAVEINPSTLACHHNLGLIYMSQNNYEEARKSFAAILAHEPENAAVFNDLGVVLTCQERPEKAIESFQQALRYDPQYEKAFVNCAELLCQLKQYEAGHQLACDFENANPENKAVARDWKKIFRQQPTDANNSDQKPTCKSFKLTAE